MKNSKFPSLRSPAAFLIGIGAAALLAGCSGRDDFPGESRQSPARKMSIKDHGDSHVAVRRVNARKADPAVVPAVDRAPEPPIERAAAAPKTLPSVPLTPPIVYAPKEAPRALAPLPDTRVTTVEPSVAAPKAELTPVKSSPSESAATPAEPRPTSAGRRALDAPATAPQRPLPAPAQLTPQVVAAVIDQAESFLRIGNFKGARVVLEPLVKARNPDALAELGKTYDPIELQKFLVPPGIADPVKAMEFYSEAARLGSAIAKSRLERLDPKQVPPLEKQR